MRWRVVMTRKMSPPLSPSRLGARANALGQTQGVAADGHSALVLAVGGANVGDRIRRGGWNCLTQSRIFSISQYLDTPLEQAASPSAKTLKYWPGPSAGSRHSELFAAACQFRDCGYGLSSRPATVPRPIKDGLDEAEAGKTVASVFRHAPRGRPQKTGTASTTSSAGGGSGGGGAGQTKRPHHLQHSHQRNCLIPFRTVCWFWLKPFSSWERESPLAQASRAPAAISSSIEASSARGTAGKSHFKSVREADEPCRQWIVLPN